MPRGKGLNDILKTISLLAKLAELHHSLCEMRNNFIPQCSKQSHILAVPQLTWVHTSSKLNLLTQFSLVMCMAISKASKFMWYSFTYAAGSIVRVNTCQWNSILVFFFGVKYAISPRSSKFDTQIFVIWIDIGNKIWHTLSKTTVVTLY